MKNKNHIYILLIATWLTTCMSASAQHKTVLHGNLGVSNVNISLVDNSHGTSTDAMGQYALALYDHTKEVCLYYSCIGYQDTIISLSTKELQHDSINISFKMKKQNYSLQEVTVTDKQLLYGDNCYFMDFEVFDSTICILAAFPDKNLRCLIMADESLRRNDSIPIPAHIKPEKVLRDCLGNCQLVASDSVYEINLMDKTQKFIATEKSYYYKTMSDCLFATDGHIYFKKRTVQAFVTLFYRISRETKEFQPLFTIDASDGAIVCPGSSLLLGNDTLYLFEQNHGYIQRYDLDMNKIDSCAIQYPFMEDWTGVLYQDLAQNKFYTVVKDQLFEIDPKSGDITVKTNLVPSLYPKIVIHNGQLLLLKKTRYSSKNTRTYIERRKL